MLDLAGAVLACTRAIGHPAGSVDGKESVKIRAPRLAPPWRRSDASAHHTCPICSAGDIERVPRDGVVDHVARLLGWRVYRCRECRSRFYDRPLSRNWWSA
jgi:hypothetical protein